MLQFRLNDASRELGLKLRNLDYIWMESGVEILQTFYISPSPGYGFIVMRWKILKINFHTT